VLLSPGFDQFDTKLLGEYGFGRFANVVSSLMLERMLSASGPTKGHIERPSDSASPKKIAWLQCVGSRDERKDKPYCSAVCCMFATKQALIIRDHYPTIETDIFYMDMRAYGKGFDSYVDRAKNTFGVRYHRGMISKIYELPEDRSLELRYVDEFGELKKEVFDLVVLSSGITPGSSVKQLAAICGVSLNEFGFAKKTITAPNKTEKPGVYVSGVIEGPRDIPETVVSASSAAALIGADISESRWSGISPKIYPPEKNVSQETPRIGVFICRCGTNIARVVDVPTLTEYAKTLPNVVHAEENLYTCSADTQLHLAEKIAEHRLNRVVVASCTPRTHEPLFQETLRDAGLNKYLFEMANIRDQCSWVHAGDADSANDKAKDLLRMAAARAARLAPLTARSIDVTKSALVVGGGVSGMSAALSLASQGFFTSIVEKEAQLGGNTRRLTMLEDGSDPSSWLTDLIRKTISNPKI
jgi:heterodisulfide reductase subunit A-like polyferredoxin